MNKQKSLRMREMNRGEVAWRRLYHSSPYATEENRTQDLARITSVASPGTYLARPMGLACEEGTDGSTIQSDVRSKSISVAGAPNGIASQRRSVGRCNEAADLENFDANRLNSWNERLPDIFHFSCVGSVDRAQRLPFSSGLELRKALQLIGVPKMRTRRAGHG